MTSYPTILGDGGHQDGSYSATRYANVGLGRCAMLAPSGFQNETYVRQRIRAAGTISELSWGLNHAFGETLTYTLRQNGAYTSLAVSFAATDTGWMTDSTDSVSVSSGDWLDFEADIGSSVTYSYSFYCATAKFVASSGSSQMLATVGPSTLTPNSVPQYVHFLGILGFGVTSETEQQFEALCSGTWEYMACYVETNGFTAPTLIINRINAAAGSMRIVIPASSLGVGNFEDTTHTDSVSGGDLLDYQFVTTAMSNNLVMTWVGCHYVTGNANCMIGGTETETAIIPEGSTQYSSLFGGGNIAGDYTRATGKIPYGASLTNYGNFLPDADATGAATFTLLINALPSLLSISSTAGETGWIIDGTHAVTVSTGDTVTNQVVGSGAAGSTVTWGGAGLLVTAS
jgi:hypothetical protein